jgi:16S rRNA (cytosine967-C5)-methyltransferase
MTARDVARRVLDRVEKGAWATPALDGELSRAGLDDRDRRLATELVYGVLRHQLRLDHALSLHADLSRTQPRILHTLRIAAYQLLFLRIPAHAAVDDAVTAARTLAGPKVGGFVNAVLRKLTLPPPPNLSIEHSLPPWILDELAVAIPDELAAAAAGLSSTPRLAGRANRRRIDRATLLARLAAEGATATPVPALPDAFFVEDLGDPSASPSFRAGLWTIQDTGAQQVVLLADPRPGMRVLDACAGVGGKSTYLAELADVTIDAADLSPTKLALLTETARRLGHPPPTTIVTDLRRPAGLGTYDLILLDAPCTGLGVLRRHPEAKYRLKPADVTRMGALQKELLTALLPHLAPGGVLVYAVCSFTRVESEAYTSLPLELDSTLRTWPHHTGADAFFAARLINRCA